MKKTVFAILFAFAIIGAKAQDPNFSQFFASPLTINPALTGSTNSDLRVFTNYRQQWVGNSTSYNTGTLSLDSRLFKEQLADNHVFGIGGFFMRDQSLNGYFKSTYASINTSYMIALDKDGNHNLGMGLAGIYGDRRLDFSQLSFSEQFGSGGFNTSAISASGGLGGFITLSSGPGDAGVSGPLAGDEGSSFCGYGILVIIIIILFIIIILKNSILIV
jgi:type IX secretion system PorP/SprF family membrane protein